MRPLSFGTPSLVLCRAAFVMPRLAEPQDAVLQDAATAVLSEMALVAQAAAVLLDVTGLAVDAPTVVVTEVAAPSSVKLTLDATTAATAAAPVAAVCSATGTLAAFPSRASTMPSRANSSSSITFICGVVRDERQCHDRTISDRVFPTCGQGGEDRTEFEITQEFSTTSQRFVLRAAHDPDVGRHMTQTCNRS